MSRPILKMVFVLFAFALLLGGGLFATGGTAQAATQHMATTQSSIMPQTSKTSSTSTIPVFVYATHVNIRNAFGEPCFSFPSTSCAVVGIASRQTVNDICQLQGQTITDLGITNNWWSDILTPDGRFGGWVSNIYIRGGQTISGVPVCMV